MESPSQQSEIGEQVLSDFRARKADLSKRKWHWKMQYCRTIRVSPVKGVNWDNAEKAYNKEHHNG